VSHAGKFGNTLDAKAGYNVFEDSSDDSSDEETTEAEDKQKAALLKKKKEEREICINHSTTEPRCMLPLDQNYGYMPITPEKTCLFTVGLFEDFRKRLFHSNILTRMYESLVSISSATTFTNAKCLQLCLSRVQCAIYSIHPLCL